MSSLTSFFPNIRMKNYCTTFVSTIVTISWLNDGLLKVFAGLLLVLQQVSWNNFWTTCERFLGEFGSDDSALLMDLVWVLVVLYAGDVIVVLAAFFRFWYRVCRSLSFSRIKSRFYCLFNLRHLDSFLVLLVFANTSP